MPGAEFDRRRTSVETREVVSLLKGLANESRLMVMCVLFEGEHSVGALNRRVELSQSALSQHLARLRELGLVRTRRDARTIYYSLAETPAMDVVQLLCGRYCTK